MNQEQLTARVLERLAKEARRDPFAWVPAVGWMRQDGAHGLAMELFGPEPTDAQLRVLASVLFRLASRGDVEAADFHRPSGGGRLGQPLGDPATAYFMLAGGGSKPLKVGGHREYGLRLPTSIG